MESFSAAVESDLAMTPLFGDPGNDFIENLIERAFGPEAQETVGFGDAGRADLDIVFVGLVGNVAERLAIVAMNFFPDEFGEFDDGSGLGGGEIEILIERGGMFDAMANAAGEISARY